MAKDPITSSPITSSPDTIKPTRRIRLIATHLRAVGPYLHGVDYDVPADVAARLVPARGFIEVVDPATYPATGAALPPIEESK